MMEPIALRETVLTPSTRRAFPRYWINFAKEYPVEECGNLLGDLRRIDSAFAPSLQADAESLCADMLGSRAASTDGPKREDDESAASCVRHAWAQPVEVAGDNHFELLLMVRKSTPNRRDIVVYKLRDVPDDVLPGLKRARSRRNRMRLF